MCSQADDPSAHDVEYADGTVGDYKTRSDDTLRAAADHIAWAQQVRSDHEATHGEAEQCGAACVVLGLTEFADEGPPEGTRLVLFSDELATALGADRVEWGEPDEHGWYTPTLHRAPAVDRPDRSGADRMTDDTLRAALVERLLDAVRYVDDEDVRRDRINEVLAASATDERPLLHDCAHCRNVRKLAASATERQHCPCCDGSCT